MGRRSLGGKKQFEQKFRLEVQEPEIRRIVAANGGGRSELHGALLRPTNKSHRHAVLAAGEELVI